jgi:formylmethanofuran dehydrogenase subunit D
MAKLTLTLITGRSTRQGIGISSGKEESEYREATGVIGLNSADMARAGLNDGDPVRLTSRYGSADVSCRGTDVPGGLAFMAFGPACNRLIGGETYASGMPDSKHIQLILQSTPFDEGN